MIIEKYKESNFILPCVVDAINYEKQLVLDIIQHKDQLFKKGQELTYQNVSVKIEKKLKDYPVQTDALMTDRKDFRKVRYYCVKINSNE